MKKFLFILINFGFVLIANTEKNEKKNNMYLFYFGTRELDYAQGTDDFLVHVRLYRSQSLTVTSLDYHAAKKTMFYTSSRRGYWSCSLKLGAFEWDLSKTCTRETTSWAFEKTPYCAAIGENYHWFTSKRILRDQQNWNPRSLAVDYVGNKLYIVDTDEKSINVYDLEGSNKTTIFENDSLIPFDVLLDPPEGLMFILAENVQFGVSQIYRANMDGSMLQLIVDNVYQYHDVLKRFLTREKSGFALDNDKKKIYFGNFKDKTIESVDYNGNRKVVVPQVKYPTSISIYKNTLYWFDSRIKLGFFGETTSEKRVIQTCKLTDAEICDENTISNFFNISIFENPFLAMKPIDPDLQTHVDSPCKNGNGGCQHHCLLKSTGVSNQSLGYSCLCNNGYKLAHDFKTCILEKVITVYDQAYVPFHMPYTALWNSAPSQRIFPLSKKLLVQLTFSNATTIPLDSSFYFFQVSKSGNAILKRNIAPKEAVDELEDYYCEPENDTKLRNYRRESIANAITFDWITKNLYYVKLNDQKEIGNLMTFRYKPFEKNSRRKFRLEYDATLAKIPVPSFLAIHPYCGYIFATLRNGSVLRLNSDGSNQMLLPNVRSSNALAIDFSNDNLYWLDNNNTVRYANLDGSDSKILFKNSLKDSMYMYVFGDYIFLKSHTNKIILRYNKTSGEMLGGFQIEDQLFRQETIGLKMEAKYVQYADEDYHPCAINNGECENFCFGIPEETGNKLNKICACDKSDDSLKTNLTCSTIRVKNPKYN